MRTIYCGESALNIYTKGSQHLEALKKPNKHKENALVRHKEDYHSGEEAEVRFRMEVVKCYARAMDRQIGEGCFILSPEADLLMNSKLNHMKPVVGRKVVSTAVHCGRRRGWNPG